MAKIKKQTENPSLQALAKAAKSVLGSDAVHKGSNTEFGEPKMFISTGLEGFDLLLDKGGLGWPCGRTIEIYGGEQTCKSGIAYDLLARTQRLGGVGVLFPSEGEYSEWLAVQYGVDLDRLIIGDSNVIEDVFKTIDKMIAVSDGDAPVTFVIDSIAGLETREEYNSEEYTKDRQQQIRAFLLRKALRKLSIKIPKTKAILFMVNQISEGESTPQGYKSKGKPPGGTAPKFFAAVRLRLENIGKVMKTVKGKKQAAGFDVRIIAEKNRLARPYQQTELRVDFDRGLIPIPKKEKKEKEDDE